MKFFISLICLSLPFGLIAQSPAMPVDVTTEMQQHIKKDIEKEIPQLMKRLEKEKANALRTEFTIDTFRVERFMAKWVDLDYRDFGMRDAAYETARLYDSLLNKYYKKLMGVLQGDDRKILLVAQKNWISFRDSEFRLVQTIGKVEYAGGGTMQQLTESSEYLNLVKSRTIVLFSHLARATQSE